ncbi:MAG: hypothetical protein A2X42_12485 [Candidatus Margulisbacteria bacterium GWF2_38_17]|nr:MAG: hypothetical protein A2X43_08470 [Candidatus Margulisbacteria bacterium GWD2_39_127]OGI05083.1 MAG: hypothetical protein A2X42_12485 [Candidatus Margulisbacteria bacterium GWF2_38_17]OGI09215.1 MAG: hypothetical protein A2X41_01405 [Candidatus Margulisbacteria bacterium GWE2_39_32]
MFINNTSSTNKSGSTGFSLIELIAALTILAILLPKIMNPMFTVLMKRVPMEEMNNASMFAESKLEDLHGLSFGNINSVSTENFSIPYNNYSYTINVNYVNGPNDLDTIAGSTTDYKKSLITVTTPSNIQYELATLFTNHGF